MQLVKKPYTAETDENLMKEVIKGDSRAFSEIYDRWSKPMLNYFYKMLWQDREKAEDFMHDKNIFNDRLKEELELLSENHKKTFILRFKHDLSIKDIAEILETSEGTVKSRIFYTLKKLGENLKEFSPVAKTIMVGMCLIELARYII